MRARTRRWKLLVESLECRATPDGNSAGDLGIQAQKLWELGLTGQNIFIGQIEDSRSAAKTINGANFDTRYHPDVQPADVYWIDGPATKNAGFDTHPTTVAGIIISRSADAAKKGIAFDAKLLSAGMGLQGPATRHPRTFQHVAKQNVPAINMSYLTFGANLDGSSLASRAVDYFSKKHDTLFVLAPHNSDARTNVPADAYNVLAVARAKQLAPDKPFTQAASPVPLLGAGGRRLVHVLAPGVKVVYPRLDGTNATYSSQDAGNSWAAPHATGTIALLQDYVWRQSGWGLAEKQAARRHEVMKAVLMNSAEKLEGILEMKRTVTDRRGKTWKDSDARDDPGNAVGRTIPIAEDFGAGFLNAARALKQLQGRQGAPFVKNYVPPGAAPPPAAVGVIGWDVNTIDKSGASTVYNRYRLPTLKGGGWISATLTWDRVLELQDTKNANGEYDAGEDFINPRTADLDLLLMKAGETDVTKSVWSSESTLYNLEHFLFNLPAQDEAYELWVGQKSPGAADYALAWWSEAGTAAPKKKIEGKEWKEDVVDGLRQSGELPIGGVKVTLHNASTGAVLDTRWTDGTGAYSFPSVDPGTYYVMFEGPYEHELTIPDAFNNQYDHIDSDAYPQSNPRIGRTQNIVVSTTDVLNVDAGFMDMNYGSIGDWVWDDVNGDGIQGDGITSPLEYGIPEVEVNLFKSDGTYMGTEWTDEDGFYQFADVESGDYYLEFTEPSRYGFSPMDQGSDDTVDSDADPATGRTEPFSLSLGQTRTDLDAGLKLVGASIGDRVWYDGDNDGTQNEEGSGPMELTVRLYAATGTLIAETRTDVYGYYQFPTVDPGDYYLQFDRPPDTAFTLPDVGDDTLDSDVTNPTAGTTDIFSLALGDERNDLDAGLAHARIGDRVWTDANRNGLQDSAEPGRAGVTVRLLDTAGGLVGETTTDADGWYDFASLPAGTYRVQVIKPSGTDFSPADQGLDDTIDSDVDSGGQSGLITVTTGEPRTDIDAGLVVASGTSYIGDYVWYDSDHDGVQDADELGVEGVTVNLLDGSGNLLATVVTGPSGAYTFAHIAAGTYQVEFVRPTGLEFTLRDQGGDDTLDSDADQSGRTAVFTLAAGQIRGDLDAGLWGDGGGGSGGSPGLLSWDDPLDGP